VKSEDIARYVAGLEKEVERIGEEIVLRSAYGDTSISYIRELEREVTDLKRQRDELRAAQTALPDVGPVTRGSSGFLRLDGANWDDDTAEEYRHLASCYLALAAHKDAEAAAADTTPDDEEFDAIDRALFGTTDGDVLDDRAELPVGEIRRLLREHLDGHRARQAKGGAALAPLVHFSPYGDLTSSCGKVKSRDEQGFTDERARTTCQDCRACFRNPSDAERAHQTNEGAA
jgi:hypothetical protein